MFQFNSKFLCSSSEVFFLLLFQFFFIYQLLPPILLLISSTILYFISSMSLVSFQYISSPSQFYSRAILVLSVFTVNFFQLKIQRKTTGMTLMDLQMIFVGFPVDFPRTSILVKFSVEQLYSSPITKIFNSYSISIL